MPIDPYKYSQKLYSQGGLNLEGYRIVIKIEDDVVKIVEVVVVGKREDKKGYKNASNRVLA